MSAITMIAASFLVSAATFALFTDAASNSANTFSAGTIDLRVARDLGDTESIPGPMFYTSISDRSGSFPTNVEDGWEVSDHAIGGWAPGDTVTRALNLYNDGSLPLKVTKLKATVGTGGVSSGRAYQVFVENMNIKVISGTNRILYNDSLQKLLSGWNNISAQLINTGPTALNLTFEAHLSPNAGNEIQGQDFIFNFDLFAEQVKNNH